MDNKITWDSAQRNELEIFMSYVDVSNSRELLSDYAARNRRVLPALKPQMSVVDICCGPVSILFNFPGLKNMVAVDSLVTQYVKKFGRINQVKYLSSKAEDLPFKDGSFDAVLCINALDHTQDWRKVISEMLRILKKGGSLYLDFEQTTYLERAMINAGWRKHLSEHHIAMLSVSAILKAVRADCRIAIKKISYGSPLSMAKIRLVVKLIFSHKRVEWEKRISSLSLPVGRQAVYYAIQLFNAIGFILWKRPHAYFTKVLLCKV
jgi:SAM-dependent methyltransferase